MNLHKVGETPSVRFKELGSNGISNSNSVHPEHVEGRPNYFSDSSGAICRLIAP
jgi:hypothetical protein